MDENLTAAQARAEEAAWRTNPTPAGDATHELGVVIPYAAPGRPPAPTLRDRIREAIDDLRGRSPRLRRRVRENLALAMSSTDPECEDRLAHELRKGDVLELGGTITTDAEVVNGWAVVELDHRLQVQWPAYAILRACRVEEVGTRG